eukprot:c17851_g1_i1 orf=208-1206(+)
MKTSASKSRSKNQSFMKKRKKKETIFSAKTENKIEKHALQSLMPVVCPCCFVCLPHHILNIHLDSCLLGSSSSASCSGQQQQPLVLTDQLENSMIISDPQSIPSEDMGEILGEAKCYQEENKHEDLEKLNPRVFPIFNKHNKTIHLIRHGHTTYNQGYFTTSVGNFPFDVTLSTLGMQQATSLGEKLAHLNAELILTSPLTRALQTLQHALDSSKIAEAVKIQVSDLHSEHVFNSGDVGRPAKMLAKEFPWLNFTGLKDTWWYSPKDAPNDPLIGLFQSRESRDHLRKRVGAFRQFLLSRTEQRIIVIGHSTFFRELGSRRMKNCEILTIRI